MTKPEPTPRLRFNRKAMKRLRTRREMGHRALARKLGMRPTDRMARHWEAGWTHPTVASIGRLALALGCDPAELLEWTTDDQSPASAGRPLPSGTRPRTEPGVRWPLSDARGRLRAPGVGGGGCRARPTPPGQGRAARGRLHSSLWSNDLSLAAEPGAVVDYSSTLTTGASTSSPTTRWVISASAGTL